MFTDRLPTDKSLREEYHKSDCVCAIDVPQDGRHRAPAARIQPALESGEM